jgi:hypothetical protein
MCREDPAFGEHATRLPTDAERHGGHRTEAARCGSAPPVRESQEPLWAEAVTVDTSGPLEAAVVQALAVVRPHGKGQAWVRRRARSGTEKKPQATMLRQKGPIGPVQIRVTRGV